MKDDRYTCERKSSDLYVLRDKLTRKVTKVNCISKVYTTNANGKALKIPGTSSKCVKSKQLLGLSCTTPPDCQLCHLAMLEQYEQNKVFMIK